MNGVIDPSGRAILSISVRARIDTDVMLVEVWIDTGFTGDLVIAKSLISKLNLAESGSVDAILADGSLIELSTFTCFVDWFGRTRRLEVVANEGDYPLLGVGLLVGLELRLNYRTLELTLNDG